MARICVGEVSRQHSEPWLWPPLSPGDREETPTADQVLAHHYTQSYEWVLENGKWLPAQTQTVLVPTPALLLTDV